MSRSMPFGGTALPDATKDASDQLRAEALHARVLAYMLNDAAAQATLIKYADNLDKLADKLDGGTVA